MNTTLCPPLPARTHIASFLGVVLDVLTPREWKTIEIAFGTLDGRRFRCSVPLASAAADALQVGVFVEINGIEMGPNCIRADSLRKSDNPLFRRA
jgi:hypothetical protein